MRLLSWNIQSGGGTRADRIVALIVEQQPDILVLGELRRSSARLLDELGSRGWEHRALLVERSPLGSVGLLARSTLVPLAMAAPEKRIPGRWVEAWSPEFNTVIAGVSGPGKKLQFDAFWNDGVATVATRVAGNYVLAGDLATGRSAVDAPKNPHFHCANHFEALQTAGLKDVWRALNPIETQFSFYVRRAGGVDGEGFRIDHVLASPSMAQRAQSCEYMNAARKRGISDHAPVLTQFAPTSNES